MLEAYITSSIQNQTQSPDSIKEALQVIWDGLPCTETNRQGCQKLFKTIKKCVKAGGGHLEHLI